MATQETEIAVLNANFKRFIEADKIWKEDSAENDRKTLEQVKYTNGRVKKIEVQRAIDEALQKQFKTFISFLASVGALGGVGSFLPELFKLFS